MKKIAFLVIATISMICSVGKAYAVSSDYGVQVIFPAGYQIGDYIEFLKVAPISAGASGNYEISINYTRADIASAATYLASVAHAGADCWREAGRVNSNGYAHMGSDGHNFTIDVNTGYNNSRFRIRTIKALGMLTEPIGVYIKVRSINETGPWTPLNVNGNDLSVNKFLPMTNDWSLYVGNAHYSTGAEIAIKAIENGNVGIGTSNPKEKLSVNGKIRAHEIKVETTNWPDYVFAKDYKLPSLAETEKHISEKGHLSGIPSAKEAEANGIDLGEMNKKLLQKIEELTLHMIELNNVVKRQQGQINRLEKNNK